MKVDDFNHSDNGFYIRKTKLYFDKASNKTPTAKPNSIVIAKRGAAISKNRVRIAKLEIALDTNLMSIFVNSENTTIYFKYLLELVNLNTIADTTSIPQLNNFHLYDANFSLPPLPEQKKIAAILTSVDNVIEKTQAQIDKLNDLKTGMMQELLTKGIGTDGKPHTQFKDSPVGRIPVGWEVLKLGDLVREDCPITYGIVQAGPHVENGVPYIRVSDMNTRTLSPNKMLRTATEIALKFKRSAVVTGDIVYALRGMIGHVHIVPDSVNGANLTQGTARISPNVKVENRYLYWTMKSPYIQTQNQNEAKGSTFREVTLNSLKNIQVCVPKKLEQKKLADFFDAIQSKININEDKLALNRKLKKALMQDLLTGKVRVTPDPE